MVERRSVTVECDMTSLYNSFVYIPEFHLWRGTGCSPQNKQFELTIMDVSYKKRAGCLQDKNKQTKQNANKPILVK